MAETSEHSRPGSSQLGEEVTPEKSLRFYKSLPPPPPHIHKDGPSPGFGMAGLKVV